MPRARDLAYEALAEVTDADQAGNRGELNVSLKQIKEVSGISGNLTLAAEIRDQAARYRQVMGPEVLLTPTALAKHWLRVGAEAKRMESRGTNQSAQRDECPTCSGDRFVTVAMRAPAQTPWMSSRGLKPNTAEMVDEVAPCPTCNPIQVGMRRFDGTPISTPDPARVMEMMQR